jgi:hypothetical protein
MSYELLFSPCYPALCFPCFLISHSPFPNDILKTVVANYALDKLKIEIAGNSHPAFPSSTLWDRLGDKFSRFYPKQAVCVRIKSLP